MTEYPANRNRGQATGLSDDAGDFDKYGEEEIDAQAGLGLLDDDPLEP